MDPDGEGRRLSVYGEYEARIELGIGNIDREM